MDANLFLPPYLTDARDRAVMGAVPLVMAPRFGTLPELAVGHSRFVGAGNGLFLEARSRVIHARMLMAELGMPYGDVEPFVQIAGDELGDHLVSRAMQLAAQACPDEWAGLVIAPDGGPQELWTPSASEASPHRVSYGAGSVDPLDVILDVHSHGRMEAFWSATDDADDAANPSPVFFSGVIGRADTLHPTVALRLVVAGRFFVLEDGIPEGENRA